MYSIEKQRLTGLTNIEIRYLSSENTLSIKTPIEFITVENKLFNEWFYHRCKLNKKFKEKDALKVCTLKTGNCMYIKYNKENTELINKWLEIAGNQIPNFKLRLDYKINF